MNQSSLTHYANLLNCLILSEVQAVDNSINEAICIDADDEDSTFRFMFAFV